MSRFILVPFEEGESREVTLPANLYSPPACSKELMRACIKAGVSADSNGKICVRDKTMNLDFKQFLKDCERGAFLSKYETLYALLNSVGHTFFRVIN